MARNVRHRSRPGITPFHAGISPSLDEAQIDRLDIKFYDGGAAFASPTSRWSFLELVSDLGPFQTPRLGVNTPTLKTNSDALPTITFETYSNRTLTVERGENRPPATIERTNASVDLIVSLARLMAHHPNSSSPNFSDPASLLLKQAEIETALSNQSLDGSDNFLPIRQWREQRPFFPGCISALANLLNGYTEQLRRVTSEDGLPPGIMAEPFDQRIRSAAALGDYDALIDLPWTNWLLRRCEIFWEYRTPDAISLVHHLRPALFAVSKDTIAADYDLPPSRPYREPARGRWRQIRNSISIMATTSNRSVEIAVYAKEYDRLRFEVRYLKNVRQIFGRNAGNSQFAPTFDGLASMLDFLRRDAQARLGRLMAALPEGSIEVDNPIHLYSEVIAAIARAGAGHPYAIERVIRLLMTNAAISPTGNEAEDRIINQLLRDGLLERPRPDSRSQEPRYTLADRYASAVLGALEGVDRRQFR